MNKVNLKYKKKVIYYLFIYIYSKNSKYKFVFFLEFGIFIKVNVFLEIGYIIRYRGRFYGLWVYI